MLKTPKLAGVELQPGDILGKFSGTDSLFKEGEFCQIRNSKPNIYQILESHGSTATLLNVATKEKQTVYKIFLKKINNSDMTKILY